MYSLTRLTFLLALVTFQLSAGVATLDERVEELIDLREASPNGLVALSARQFDSLALSRGRPYDLAVFLSAEQVMDHPQTQLRVLRDNYAAAARLFAHSASASQRLFFVEINYESEPSLFKRMGVSGVPFVFHLPADFVPEKPRKFEVPEGWKMMPRAAYPWNVNEFVKFFGDKAGIDDVTVPVPAWHEKPGVRRAIMGALITLAVLGWAVVRFRLLFARWPYMVGCLFVFWLSTSGVMYTYLRGVPWYIRDKDGNIQLMLSGDQGGGARGASLGAEGLLMGSAYMAFSGVVVLMTWALPRVKGAFGRRVLGYILLAAFVYLGDLIFRMHRVKTGYAVRTYLW